MSKVFFTGCTHFDHANIISLADRPFGSVEEMNETLVENWNKVVKNNDEVFVLGDFTYHNEDHSWQHRATFWNAQLNGRKYLILGNHDEVERWQDNVPMQTTKFLNCGFSAIYNYLDLKRGGKHFILFHYPMEDWDRRYKGSIHLHCHTHQKVLERPLVPYIETSGLSDHPADQPPSKSGLTLPGNYPEGQYCNRFNVTVEATNYTPISMDEILDRSIYKEHIPL